ncbi:MAG: TIGR01777 family protein [Verrucomicrobia bacterium]|nr:TIGR01777 family protein [Verrucomicrobiota bacterium]
MKIVISGSTGLIGSALVAHFRKTGHEVVRLVRTNSGSETDALRWDPVSGVLESSRMEEADAVIHLAGRNLTVGRWTKTIKAQIRHSRVHSTQFLSETLGRLRRPPKVLASASGIGIYGHRNAEILTEESASGTGFLAEVCQQWESATAPASEAGIRVAHLRFGVVLSSQGGALAKMLLPFKLGLGGTIGTGGQYWSWVSINDTIRAIQHVLLTEKVSGAVNVVSPEAVTNHQFTRTLGFVLRRPTLLSMPAAVARIAFGEMAEAALLASTRVVPKKLLSTGFVFEHTDLAEALRALL